MKNNVCFEYGNNIIVSSNPEEVKNWINSIPGLTCNEHTEDNINRIINNEWVVWGYYNQNKSPLNKGGFRLEHLKTTGIGNGEINFFLTKCETVEEVLSEREAYKLKIENLKNKVAEIKNTIGLKLLEKLSKKSKSCVDLLYFGGTKFVLKIGENGYWYNDGFGGNYAYINEYFTHFDGETLITDEKKNLIDILNQFIDEN